MALTGLPYYGYCPYSRIPHEDGSFTEVFEEGALTTSIINFQDSVSREQQQLWAGDLAEETVNGVPTGTVQMERSRLRLQEEARITGNPLREDGEFRGSGNATPPYCRTGAMARELIDGKEMFIVAIYTAVMFSIVPVSYATKTNTAAFQNRSLTGTVNLDANGDYVRKKEFTEADGGMEAALAYFKALLFIRPSVAMPTATPLPGSVSTGTKVTLTVAAGLQIRYTTDGGDVQATTGILYENPIPLTETTLIKARAYDPTEAKSPSMQFVGNYVVADLRKLASFGAEISDDMSQADVKKEMVGALNEQTKAELYSFAKDNSLPVTTKDTKATLIGAIMGAATEEW